MASPADQPPERMTLAKQQEADLPPPLARDEKFAVTGIVLGLTSLVLWLVLPMGIVLGVPGFIMSYLGRRSKKRNLARVGMLAATLGIIGSLTAIGIVLYLNFTASP